MIVTNIVLYLYTELLLIERRFGFFIFNYPIDDKRSAGGGKIEIE